MRLSDGGLFNASIILPVIAGSRHLRPSYSGPLAASMHRPDAVAAHLHGCFRAL